MWLTSEATGEVEIAVYDVLGRLVWKSDTFAEVPGLHPITWNAQEMTGRAVAPGVYFARASIRGRTASAKIVMLR